MLSFEFSTIFPYEFLKWLEHILEWVSVCFTPHVPTMIWIYAPERAFSQSEERVTTHRDPSINVFRITQCPCIIDFSIILSLEGTILVFNELLLNNSETLHYIDVLSCCIISSMQRKEQFSLTNSMRTSYERSSFVEKPYSRLLMIHLQLSVTMNDSSSGSWRHVLKYMHSDIFNRFKSLLTQWCVTR